LTGLIKYAHLEYITWYEDGSAGWTFDFTTHTWFGSYFTDTVGFSFNDIMQLSDIGPIFDMNKSKKGCSTATVNTTSQQFKKKIVRNLECTRIN